MTTSLLRRALLPAAVVASLALAACGSGDPLAEDPADDAAGGAASEPAPDTASDPAAAPAGGAVVVGGANFTEMQVMEEIYGALLTDAGYEVEIVASDSREIYGQALVDGEIDVVPEYAATMAEYLNREINGPEAELVATSDAAETVEAMQPLAEELGLVVGEPAEAASQNGYAILESVATENDITTLSDFAAFQPEIVLAATEECPDRPFCQIGLEGTYGFTVTRDAPARVRHRAGQGGRRGRRGRHGPRRHHRRHARGRRPRPARGRPGPPAGRQPRPGVQRRLGRGHHLHLPAAASLPPGPPAGRRQAESRPARPPLQSRLDIWYGLSSFFEHAKGWARDERPPLMAAPSQRLRKAGGRGRRTEGVTGRGDSTSGVNAG